MFKKRKTKTVKRIKQKGKYSDICKQPEKSLFFSEFGTNMASAKIAKVKKQTPKKAVEAETEDGKKLSDYEILTTIGKPPY